MRKYDNKNKRFIGLILIIGIIIIIIFSIFLKKVLDAGKVEYTISTNSIVFDSDKNMYTTEEDATIKVKWSGNYYMYYDDDLINLSDHSVIYNKTSGNINLYGTFYEILNNEDVDILKDENIIKNSVNSRFFKIDDRKYLIVDKTIESDDGNLVTSNYLLIDIDKSGNATFLNDSINLKTFNPTIIKTSSFTFNISKETINFGGEDIDLKEIIGSTNEYDENKKIKGEVDTKNTGDGTGGTGTGSGSGTGESGNGTEGSGSSGTGTGGSSSNVSLSGNGTGNASSTTKYVGEYNSKVSDKAVADIINATKKTSIIRITSSISSLSIDYVIYDPENEYQSVYVDVEEANNISNTKSYTLSKNDTSATINDLSFDTLYNLYFKYTYYNDSGVLVEERFDEVSVVTKVPEISLKVTSFINNKLTYQIDFDNYYTVSDGYLMLYSDSMFVKKINIEKKGNLNTITDTIDIDSKSLTGSTVSLTLSGLTLNDKDTFNPDISFKFKK